MNPQATTEDLLKILGATCSVEDLVSCESEAELACLTPYSQVIAAWEELKRREASRIVQPRLSSPQAVANLMRPFANDPVEHFWVIAADTGMHVLGIREVAKGTINAACQTFREILAPVIQLAAPSFYVVHNHPAGGDASDTDITMTWKLLKACDIVGLSLLDHVIIKPDGTYISLRERIGWTPFMP